VKDDDTDPRRKNVKRGTGLEKKEARKVGERKED
jgi:hypothetical protein